MILYLSNNVYLVPGKVCAVFYDFNRGRLVHVSEEAKNLLCRVLGKESAITQEECDYLNRLVSLGLLTEKYVAPHDISELKENPVIDFVWIEVTTFCNLKCIHCYNEADCKAGKVMSYEDFCYVIDELVSFGVRKIQIIGGEPLTLGDELIRYLDYLDGKFEYAEIFTNGTLLDDKLTDYIREHRIRIALSLYSYNAGEHDKVTQVSGSWEKTNAAIQKLKDNDITYTVKNVLMRDAELGERNTELYELNPMKDVVRLTGRASSSLLTKELARKRLITKKSFQRRLSKAFVKRCIKRHDPSLQ